MSTRTAEHLPELRAFFAAARSLNEAIEQRLPRSSYPPALSASEGEADNRDGDEEDAPPSYVEAGR